MSQETVLRDILTALESIAGKAGSYPVSGVHGELTDLGTDLATVVTRLTNLVDTWDYRDGGSTLVPISQSISAGNDVTLNTGEDMLWCMIQCPDDGATLWVGDEEVQVDNGLAIPPGGSAVLFFVKAGTCNIYNSGAGTVDVHGAYTTTG
jgi:hypothetical protein